MTPTYDGKPILQAAQPPEGTTCAGCGAPILHTEGAVTRDNKTYYHSAAYGGCEAKGKGA